MEFGQGEGGYRGHGNRFLVCSDATHGVTIGQIEKEDVTRVKVGTRDITIDSAVEESVCSKDWGRCYPIKEAAEGINLRSANGGRIGHYGEREVNFMEKDVKCKPKGMTCQASDVRKPFGKWLASWTQETWCSLGLNLSTTSFRM